MMHKVRDGISGGEVFAHARVIGIVGGVRSESGGCEDDGWTTRHDSKKDGVVLSGESRGWNGCMHRNVRSE